MKLDLKDLAIVVNGFFGLDCRFMYSCGNDWTFPLFWIGMMVHWIMLVFILGSTIVNWLEEA